MCTSLKCGCVVSKVGQILLIVGGINWGLVGLGSLLSNATSWNLVAMIFGGMPWLEAVIYVLVGVAAVMSLVGCRCGKCKSCASCNAASPSTGGQM